MTRCPTLVPLLTQSWDSKLRGTHRRHLAPSGAARALPRALPCAAPEPEPKPRDTEAILQALLEAVVGKEPFWVLPAATTSGIDSAPASAATPTGERSSAQPADDRLPAPVALTIYASFSGLLVLAAMATPTVEFLQVGGWEQLALWMVHTCCEAIAPALHCAAQPTCLPLLLPTRSSFCLPANRFTSASCHAPATHCCRAGTSACAPPTAATSPPHRQHAQPQLPRRRLPALLRWLAVWSRRLGRRCTTFCLVWRFLRARPHPAGLPPLPLRCCPPTSTRPQSP